MRGAEDISEGQAVWIRRVDEVSQKTFLNILEIRERSKERFFSINSKELYAVIPFVDYAGYAQFWTPLCGLHKLEVVEADSRP